MLVSRFSLLNKKIKGCFPPLASTGEVGPGKSQCTVCQGTLKCVQGTLRIACAEPFWKLKSKCMFFLFFLAEAMCNVKLSVEQSYESSHDTLDEGA